MATEKYNKEFYDGNYGNLVLNKPRTKFRQFVRDIYLSNSKKLVIGKAIDFGCGACELLQVLPEGSLGLEVIPEIVEMNKKKGLNVKLFDPNVDDYTFDSLGIKYGDFETFISMHVFEHLENSAEILKKVFQVCHKIGVKRIIIIVPCLKGFTSLEEHITYVNKDYLVSNKLTSFANYSMTSLNYFPFNLKIVGDFFIHNEMVAIWDIK